MTYQMKVGQPITKEQLTMIRQHSVDAITLLGSLNAKLEQTRRDYIVNTLPKELKPVRKLSDENSQNLFVDVVVGKMSELKKASNLMKDKRSNNYQTGYNRYQGYKGNQRNYSYTSKKDWQANKGSSNSRPFQNQHRNVQGRGTYQGRQNKK